MPSRAELTRYAIQLVQLGWSVIPAQKKIPLVPWKDYAYRKPNPEEWREWASRLDFNAIALVLGPATRPGGKCLWILDVEAEYRDEVEKKLADTLSNTTVVETHSGGLHLYFVADRPVQTRRCKWGDILGDHHIVILPPSEWDGKAYKWLTRKLLMHATPEEILGEDPHQKPYTRVLQGESIYTGTRNVTLTSLAGWLWRHPETTKEALHGILQAVNTYLCNPPLPAAEVSRIAESISRYPKEVPRDGQVAMPVEIVDIPSLSVDIRPVLQVGNIPVYPGETIVLSGMPGSGKSTWIFTHMPPNALLLETDFDAKIAAWLADKLGVRTPFKFGYVAVDAERFIATLQSVAGEETPPVAVFIDTIQGVSSDPDTLDFIVQYVRDFATRTGIPIIVASHENRRDASPMERIQGTLRLAQEATLVLRIVGNHRSARRIYVLKDRYAIVRNLPSSWDWNVETPAP
jgi:hypothetical protein